MPWVKFDDQAESHRKFRRAGLDATGLYFLASSYCARYLTDGHVDHDWLEEKVPNKAKRDKLLRALVDNGLFDKNGTGYVVHDYLDHNPSREEYEQQRKAKQKAGKRSAQARANA